MRALRSWFVRLGSLFAHKRRESELAAELDTHLQLHIDDNLRAGMTPRAARREAVLKLGRVITEERYRDRRGIPVIYTFWRDMRFAARLFVKDRWVTLTAVTTLALGIAANNTAFTLVNAMVLRGLPVKDPGRIVIFNETPERLSSVSYRDIEDWRAALTTMSGIAGYIGTSMTIGDEQGSPEVFFGSYISANAFSLIGETPLLGRSFVSEDDRPGAQAVAILGYRAWTRRYGADPSIVGRTIRINNVPSVVVGVMREGFKFPFIDELWQPLRVMPGLSIEPREPRTLRAFGRLADGVSISEAQSELNAITTRLSHDYPETNKDMRAVVMPFTGTVNHPIFLALFGAVGFVLLIACANVANLLLVRSMHRAREIAIRVSLGATRWCIVRQLLVEGVLLAVLAGVLGLILSIACVRLFAYAVSGINFPFWYNERWTMDGRVFAFLSTLSLGTVFLFGLVPALHLSRRDINESIKECGRASTAGRVARRWTTGLLIGELAFTLVLLVGASLMIRSFLAIYQADRIVDSSHLLTMGLRLPNSKYSTAAERLALYHRIEERLSGLGSISSATIASTVPFVGGLLWQVELERHPRPSDERPPMVSYVTIGAQYFDTLGVPLVRGRSLTDVDGTAGHENAIVNQRFVSTHFANVDPLGQRIRITNPDDRGKQSPWLTIVGVSPTVRQQFFSELDPVVYVPNRADAPARPTLMIRSQNDPAALISILREEVRALDADIPLSRSVPLETLMEQSRWGHRVFGAMFAVFAAIAVILAAVGIYAVTAYGVTQRTPEIGVRMALGAKASQVVWLFFRRTIVQLVVGLLIGFAGAFGVGRLMQRMLVQTSANDPVTLVSVAALLIAVAVISCLWPAWRATSISPIAALRYE